MMEEALQKLKIPTRKEIEELKARIERLEKERGSQT
jgi:polyhydroxyalkanoate synthesis regulator phasin